MFLKFKAFLVEHKIKAEEVADVCGISVASFYSRMSGRTQFLLIELRRISERYNISIDEYFVAA